MHVGMILEMASENLSDRVAFGAVSGGITFGQLGQRARRAGTWLAGAHGDRVVLADENSLAVPLGLFGAAVAGKPFVPVNYRLADDRLRAVIRRTAPATVVAGAEVTKRLGRLEDIEIIPRDHFLGMAEDESVEPTDGWSCDPDAPAVLLFTSGTTGEPKAAVLRHKNLVAYVVNSLQFGGATEDEAAIISVPPYHIASVSSALSTTYTGRRAVYLESFDPASWAATVRTEEITHAMVVPTMFTRILDVIEAEERGLPSMRCLAYGGGPMPQSVVERALRLLPHVDLVNAYGLTETASTVAVLGPDDHRAAFASNDPSVRARLSSVGQPLPGVEVSVRDGFGQPVPAERVGQIWVRGAQVSGEYEGFESSLENGWFNTRDAGRLDEDSYLYVYGRLDDVIVRGGENLSPGEIEAVLLKHPAVAEAAVFGVPDVEWGEVAAAAVVLEPDASVTPAELREHVRAKLRSARTPERIMFRDELPFNETGKLLRRVLRGELTAKAAAGEPMS